MILFVDGQEIGLVLSVDQPPRHRIEDEHIFEAKCAPASFPPTTILVEGNIYGVSDAPQRFRLERPDGSAIEGRAIISAERAGYRRGVPLSELTFNCQELTLIDAREYDFRYLSATKDRQGDRPQCGFVDELPGIPG